MLAWVFPAAIAGLTLNRLRFGVDFTDEAYYLAMALRFLRGGIPFIDELSFNQTSAILVLPFFRPYYHWFGTEGFFLFSRLLYFSFCLFVALTLFLNIKRVLPRYTALLISLVVVVHIPLNIPSLCYNTFGSLFLLMGLVWGWRFSLEGERGAAFLSGLAFGFSVLTYPTLFFIAAFFGVLFFSLNPRNRRGKGLLLWCAGGGLPLFAFLPYLLRAGDEVGRAVAYSLVSYQYGGGWEKLRLVVRHLFWENASWRVLPALLCVGVSLLTVKHSSKVARGLLFCFPVLVLMPFLGIRFPSVWFFTYFSLVGGAAYFVCEKKESLRLAFCLVWIPSVVAGMVTAWSSSSSAANAILGLAPAFVFSMLFLSEALRTPWVAISSLGVLCFFQYAGRPVYRDGALSQLRMRVQHGPYRGLYTSEEKAQFLEEVTSDIHRLENPKGRVLFYEFPAGYLLTEMKEASNESWLRSVSQAKRFQIRYYSDHPKENNLIFEMRNLVYDKMEPVEYSEKDSLNEYILKTHELILSKQNYLVFSPKEGTG